MLSASAVGEMPQAMPLCRQYWRFEPSQTFGTRVMAPHLRRNAFSRWSLTQR